MEVPSIAPSDTFRFRVRRRTRWSDEDNQRVVNNAVYMTLLEEARHEYFDGLGLLSQNQFPFVLMQTNIRFLAPTVGGHELEIELRTVELGRTSIRQEARIRCTDDARGLVEAQVLIEAEVLLVSWDNAGRCKAPTGEEFRARVTEFEGLDVPDAGRG